MTARLAPRTYETTYTAPCPEPCGTDATWTSTAHSPTGEPPFTTTHRITHEGECKTMTGDSA